MKTWIFATALVAALSACTASSIEKLPYHKLTIFQGMPLNHEAVLAIKPGMSRQQVMMEIGQPMLIPSFRNDRWDYVYEITRGGETKESRQLIIIFNQNNTVERIEGSALDEARQIEMNQQGNP